MRNEERMRRILAQKQEENGRAEVTVSSAPILARKMHEDDKKEILEMAPTLPPPPAEVEDNVLPTASEVVTELKKEDLSTLDKSKKKKVK